MVLENVYKEQILSLYRNPMNNREIEGASISQKGHNPSCGDNIVIELAVEEGTIVDAAFTGEGCAITIASVSLLTEEVRGKKLADILAIGDDQALALLSIPISPGRMKCALLPLATVQKAIQTYES